MKTRVGDPHNAREPHLVPAVATSGKAAPVRPSSSSNLFHDFLRLRTFAGFIHSRTLGQHINSRVPIVGEAACECDRSSFFSRPQRRLASRFNLPRSRRTIAALRSSRWLVRRMSGGFAVIRFRIPIASSPAYGKTRHNFRTNAARCLNPTTARRGAAGGQPMAITRSLDPRTTTGSDNRRGAMFADVDPFG